MKLKKKPLKQKVDLVSVMHDWAKGKQLDYSAIELLTGQPVSHRSNIKLYRTHPINGRKIQCRQSHLSRMNPLAIPPV